MRIGIDCRLWNQTGVGRYIRNLVMQLATIESKNTYVLFFKLDEFETVVVPSKNFEKKLADIPWHSVKEQTEFPHILHKEKLDLMHFPYFSYPLWYKGKFVITIHDLILDHFPTGKATTLPLPFYALKRYAYHYVISQATKKAAKIIAVSKATKQEILEHYQVDVKKISVTYEGIDEETVVKKTEKIDVKLPYFLYVGNAYPHKNLERLIEAISLMEKGANLILVGKEDYFYARLRKVVERTNATERIFFYQHITDKQLAFLYQHALALVAPSLMEGFGLPLIEAMANRCLVVASEIPAFLEVCQDAALYINPYDSADIARVLTMVVDGKIPHIQGKKEKGLMQTRLFSWKKMARETLEIYESCTSLR